MPDKWEYPWFAAWDLAFHMIPFARIDPALRQGAAPAAAARVVHAPERPAPGLRVRVRRREPAGARLGLLAGVQDDRRRSGQRDRLFLERAFQKLLLNFTWWVNRKDPEGNNLFAGGFLGLDNIGVFDRSQPLPTGGHLEQADGTAWMAFYCTTMLSMALELAQRGPGLRGRRLQVLRALRRHRRRHQHARRHRACGTRTTASTTTSCTSAAGTRPLRVRSLVGLMPLIAAEVLDEEMIEQPARASGSGCTGSWRTARTWRARSPA